MELLWSYTDAKKITSCALATDEEYILVPDSSVQADLAKEGWIALGCYRPHPISSINSSKAATIKKAGRKSKKATEETMAEESEIADYEIIVLSLTTGEILVHSSHRAQVTSLTFLHHGKSFGLNNDLQGLVALTIDSEMMLIAPPTQTLPQLSDDSLKIAQVKSSSLPTVEIEITNDEDMPKVEIFDSSLLTKSKSLVSSSSRTTSNKFWFTQYLPDSTLDLPKPSDIASKLLLSILS